MRKAAVSTNGAKSDALEHAVAVAGQGA